jgi:two-component system copper resistance phosphate regulon response regulator CusR
MRILVVEDDVVIATTIRRSLERERFVVQLAADGLSGVRLAKEGHYGAIILDVMLPGQDGWAVCAALRARRNQTPVLMLTARDSIQDRVRSLETGADDYLAKPFDTRELVARVRALLRRGQMHKSSVIRIADLEIDTYRARVVRAGREVQLTPREYELLEALAANEGKVFTREMIQEQVWMDDACGNSLSVHVANLRKKIDSGHPVKLIQTVHGFGYTLRVGEQVAA